MSTPLKVRILDLLDMLNLILYSLEELIIATSTQQSGHSKETSKRIAREKRTTQRITQKEEPKTPAPVIQIEI